MNDQMGTNGIAVTGIDTVDTVTAELAGICRDSGMTERQAYAEAQRIRNVYRAAFDAGWAHEQALRANHLYDLDQERYGHVASWNRELFYGGTA